MRMLPLPSPEGATLSATESARPGRDSYASDNYPASQPSSNKDGKLVLSQRVPTGPLLRNAAQQAATVLQERREGIVVGGNSESAQSGFDWANSSYDRKSRGVRIWLYAIDLRLSLALLDKKWSYMLGTFRVEVHH